MHQTDFVGPCYLHGPVRFYSLNSVDVTTGRCAVLMLRYPQTTPVTPALAKAGQHTIDAIWSQVDNEPVFYDSRRHPRGMGSLIRLCLAYEVEPWFIPLAEPWRNGVVEKFNDHYRGGFLRKVAMSGAAELGPQSLLFEQKENAAGRVSKEL